MGLRGGGENVIVVVARVGPGVLMGRGGGVGRRLVVGFGGHGCRRCESGRLVLMTADVLMLLDLCWAGVEEMLMMIMMTMMW